MLAILRKGFIETLDDPDFRAEIDKAQMEFDFVPGPAIDKIVAQIAATAPDVAARYARAFAPDGK